MSEHPRYPTSYAAALQASGRERLVQARYQREWSQQELADLLGTTPLNISRWERGLTSPNPYFRRKLCATFGLSEIELGLRPDPALLREATSPQPPASLPLYDPFLPLPATMPLVGRAVLLQAVKEQLVSTRSIALVALHGLPGVGKTALALELAYDPELREHYPDGLLWAALGPQPNLPGLLSRWGQLLGIREDETAHLSTLEAWTRTLRATIGTRRLLFVLDDAWSLEHALACQVGGPQCAYVLTTRLPQLAQSFALNAAYTIETLEEEAGLELLRQMAPWAVEQAYEHIHTLVQAMGGLPLALSLVGHTLRQQTHDRQPRRLRAALQRLQDRLTRLQLGQPPGWGQRSLQEVLKSSAEQLTAEARHTWAALSILPARPHSFSEEVARTVSGQGVEILDELSDAGVLEAVGPERYTLHQVLADYGRAQLEAPEESEARKRLIDYSLRYAQEHSESYLALEEDTSVLTAALESCAEQNEQEAQLGLTLALAQFWKARGNHSQAELWLPRAGDMAQKLGRLLEEAQVRLLQGGISLQQGNYEQARLSYEQGLALARQVNDTAYICWGVQGICWVDYKRGRYEQTEQLLHEGLELARRHELVGEQAELLQVLGAFREKQGKMEQGLAYLQEGLQLAQRIDDYNLTCTLFNNLGVFHYSLGHIEQAVDYFRNGLALARQHGYRHWEGLILPNLGILTLLQGDYTQAQQRLQEGLKLARQLGIPEYIDFALINLGEAALAYGNYQQAEQYLQEGLSLARQLDIPEFSSTTLASLGELLLARGHYRQAEQYLQEGLDTARRVGLSRYITQALHILGEVALACGNDEQAEQLLREGFDLAHTIDAHEYKAKLLTSLGAAAQVRGNYEQAEQYLREGLNMARQIQVLPPLCRALYQWGLLELQRDQLEEAMARFEEILETAPGEARLERALAHYGLAQAHAAQGKTLEARQIGREALTALEALEHREASQVRRWLKDLEEGSGEEGNDARE